MSLHGRGDRAADCAALEMLCPRKGTVGSNPALSAYSHAVTDRTPKITVSGLHFTQFGFEFFVERNGFLQYRQRRCWSLWFFDDDLFSLKHLVIEKEPLEFAQAVLRNLVDVAKIR